MEKETMSYCYKSGQERRGLRLDGFILLARKKVGITKKREN